MMEYERGSEKCKEADYLFWIVSSYSLNSRFRVHHFLQLSVSQTLLRRERYSRDGGARLCHRDSSSECE
jgi:hypothetical protein